MFIFCTNISQKCFWDQEFFLPIFFINQKCFLACKIVITQKHLMGFDLIELNLLIFCHWLYVKEEPTSTLYWSILYRLKTVEMAIYIYPIRNLFMRYYSVNPNYTVLQKLVWAWQQSTDRFLTLSQKTIAILLLDYLPILRSRAILAFYGCGMLWQRPKTMPGNIF